MEKQFKLTYDGQSVQRQDVDNMGESAGLADDRLLATLLRVTPFDGTTVARGLIPATPDLIAPNGATGSVKIGGFRAVVGSRVTAGTNALSNHRDVRSVDVAPSTLNLAANASGNPRWDLILAAITPDAALGTDVRDIKNVTTSIIAPQSVPTYYDTTCTISVTAGTPAASPVFPATPADSGTTYYVVLGYVRVPNGFTAASTVAVTDIAITANCFLPSLGAGGGARIASSNYGPVSLRTADQQTWGSTGTRPRPFVSSTMVGSDELYVFLNVSSTVAQAWPPHQAVIDARDWRNRFSDFMVVGASGSASNFAWNTVASTPNDASGMYRGCGNSFQLWKDMDASAGTVNGAVLAYANNTIITSLPATTFVSIYCDLSDGGKLKAYYSSTGSISGDFTMAFWIRLSAPFANAL